MSSIPISPLSNRRDFIRTAALAASGVWAARPGLLQAEPLQKPAPEPEGLSISIFSKHLQFLGYEEMAEAAADIGFDGIDLTVRPEGHVPPENASTDLPKAVAAIHAAGLTCETITTAVDDASDPIDSNLLRAAADQGIRFYRMNWFRYPERTPLPQALDGFAKKVAALSDLNRELGLVGAYQNHAGNLVGSSLWEVWQLLEDARLAHFGIQYDIRHALVEGGLSWQNGLQLALPHIKTIVLKDFKWIEKDGRNQIVNTPIGEGTVDFLTYFRILKKNKVKVPVSLHLEYDLGGAQWGQSQIELPAEKVFQAMRRDLAAARSLWAEA